YKIMEKNNRIGYSKPYSVNLGLAMKLTTVLLILSIFTVQANSYSQKTKVTLDLEKVSIQKVFEEIESLTDFKFLYDNKKIDAEKLVSVKADNQPISDVLKNLFKDTSIYYLVRQKQIVLKIGTAPIPAKIKEKSEDIEELKLAQRIISGAITDDKGQPLPGANVVEKGTTNGVTADFDGNFSISVKDENAILLVSYIGFATREINVNGQTRIMVSLEESAVGMDEVVVVGYGTQVKGQMTGSVSTVQGEQLTNRSIGNSTQALQGLVQGLRITQSAGQPGKENLDVNIRGISTFTNNPVLTIVDGIPTDLNSLNQNDIESISVLKDAAAASIYGTRASGGVILITTKKGKKGAPKLSYSGTVGMQQA